MKKRRIAAALTGGLLAVAMGVVGAPSAQADEPTKAPTSEHDRIVNFWTKERMAKAKPVELDEEAVKDSLKNDKKAKQGKEFVVKPRAAERDTKAEGSPETGGPWTKGGKVEQTTGKVFFTDPEDNGLSLIHI